VIRTILSFGPHPKLGAEGESSYLLSPPDEAESVVVSESLGQALPSLRALAPRDDLGAEPTLAGEAAALGLSIIALDETARATLGLLAFEVEIGESFAFIGDDRLVVQFARAAARFAASGAGGWAAEWRRLGVSTEEARHCGLITTAPGLILLDAPSLFGANEDGLAVQFDKGHPSVVEALWRAFSLNAVPEPFRWREGRKTQVDDQDLALLTAAMNAVSVLRPGIERSAVGDVEVGTVYARVTVTFAQS
jgi:hypothetical protein